MEQINKRGVTIVTLVITVIILLIITGTVILIMEETDIFDNTRDTVDTYNKKALIDEINQKIKTEKLKKINETGIYIPLSTQEIEDIITEYGVYDEETKIVTLGNGTRISLFEIVKEAVNEYIEVDVQEDKLIINTELSREEYVIEYTIDAGKTWIEYTGEVEVGDADAEVRVTDKNGIIISKPETIEINTNGIELTNITVMLHKTTYKAGETISKEDLTVEAIYSDGTKKEVTNYTHMPIGELTVNDKYVTVTYKKNKITKNVRQAITVTNKLVQIGVQGEIKTEYKKGDSFDTTGLKVMAEYEDGSIKEVTDYTYSPNTPLTENDTEVIISYTEEGIKKTIPIAIEVTSMSHIEIYDVPSKQVYAQGQDFSLEGTMIVVHYKNGTNKTIMEGFEIEGGENLQVGQESVTLRYTENELTAEIEVPIVVTNNLVRIEVQVNKNEYIQGESVTKGILTVTAIYEDITTNKEVTDYEIVGGDNVQVGQTSVEIRYTEEGIEATATGYGPVNSQAKEYTVTENIEIAVRNNLLSIEYKSGPTNKIYKHSDYFDTTGLVLIATYEDGSTKEITSGIIRPLERLTYGQTSVTVRYNEGGITKTVEITGITVNRVVDKIEVTTLPPPRTYNHGDTFDTEGMEITATYTDGGSEVVTSYDVTNGILEYGQKGVTISYTENGVTKETTILVTVQRVLASIQVSGDYQTVYVTGENFDKERMKVTAIYTDGGSEELANTKYTVSKPTYGSTEVTVSYTEGEITKSVQVTGLTVKGKFVVTYDYTTNGGTSATTTTATVVQGDSIDLSPTATKSGWIFVGWNTTSTATTGLSNLDMSTSDVTLFAIYSKTVVATYVMGISTVETSSDSKTFYNNADVRFLINLPSIPTEEGCTAIGWKNDIAPSLSTQFSPR